MNLDIEIDNFRKAVEKAVLANVNAARCQTRIDWERAHEADAEEDEARRIFKTNIRLAMTGGKK